MNASLNNHRSLRFVFSVTTMFFFFAMGLGLVQSLSSYHRLPPINSHYMPEITALIENEDYGKVIPQLELASSIDPADTEKNKQLLAKVCSVAAQSLIKAGRFKDAIIQYDRAYRASPDSIDVQNNLAWILATCPDKDLRDAPRAVTLAEQAARSTNYADASMLDTLAAAYAEAGDFANAVRTQREAIRLTPANYRSGLQQRLDLYLRDKPYHSRQSSDGS
jgi:tetratricopeptide (TPR) repeat protein